MANDFARKRSRYPTSGSTRVASSWNEHSTLNQYHVSDNGTLVERGPGLTRAPLAKEMLGTTHDDQFQHTGNTYCYWVGYTIFKLRQEFNVNREQRLEKLEKIRGFILPGQIGFTGANGDLPGSTQSGNQASSAGASGSGEYDLAITEL